MKRYLLSLILMCAVLLFAAPVSAVTADFTYSVDALNPMTIHFTDTSTGGSGNWFWDFNDGGATSTSQNPSHTFNSEGEYRVSLAASDANYNGEDTEFKWITVTRSGVVEDGGGSPGTSSTPSGGSSGSSGGSFSLGGISIPNPIDLINEYLALIKKMIGL